MSVPLVACKQCHAQYDVSGIRDKEFPCRCGATLASDPPEARDAEIRRCGACGALVDFSGGRCDYCGSSVLPDPRSLSLICPECCGRNDEASRFCTACGVAFAPEQIRVDGYELPCPRCSCLMPPRQVGGIGINECASCHGIWVPAGKLDQIVERSVEAGRQGRPGLTTKPQAPRMQGANPARQPVEYRNCPRCEAFMQRRNFRKTSGVIVDHCAKHGTWLDADELEQIAGFLVDRGAPEHDARVERTEVASGPLDVRRQNPVPSFRERGAPAQQGPEHTLFDLFSQLLR